MRVDVPSVPVHGLSVVTPDRTPAPRAARRAGAAPIGRVVRRVEFDHAFAEEARARGVRVVEGARVTGLAFERDGVRVDTSQGELRARAVVGADGVGSFVRRALGAPRGRWMAQVVEVDTPPLKGEPRDVLHFDLGDRSLLGYAWDFPTIVAGAPLVCRGAYALRPDPETRSPGEPGLDVGAHLLARLDRLGLGAFTRLKRFSERGLSLHEPLGRPRALLVGEAAGIDPALGEGIAQAIAYGAVAGPYLAGAIERDDLGFTDWPGELRRSRVGLDLRLRAAFTPWLYGRARPLVEGWAAGSPDLAIAGMRYWAGERVPRLHLLKAALSGVATAARLVRASTYRRPAWW